VIPAASVRRSPAEDDRTSAPEVDHEPSVVRPEHFDQLTDVVDRLRAGRPVLLGLDRVTDAAERRRALTFMTGAAYALSFTVAPVAQRNDTFLLDPCAASDRNGRTEPGAGDPTRRARTATAPRGVAGEATCVLCDLRTADRQFEPRLEMVIKRDGSRIWSPPALVCSHCRSTIRHWQFALAWCPQCERWGRRNVVSPCGQLYS
jgi:hypothetical protein